MPNGTRLFKTRSNWRNTPRLICHCGRATSCLSGFGCCLIQPQKHCTSAARPSSERPRHPRAPHRGSWGWGRAVLLYSSPRGIPGLHSWITSSRCKVLTFPIALQEADPVGKQSYSQPASHKTAFLLKNGWTARQAGIRKCNFADFKQQQLIALLCPRCLSRLR